MATNNRIVTTELDFDQIKLNLKNYFKGQTEFSDYDFEGSALSVLLDVLAYNTHYNALYTNLAVNESFLDSASKRSSVVSLANELGYVPRSSKAATAVISLTATSTQLNAPAFLELPKNSIFTTVINEVTYSFITLQSYTAYKNGNNQYVFADVELKEGQFLEYKFNVATGARYIIPNNRVDTATIKVEVQENIQSSVTETFVESKTVVNLNSTSAVYFVKEIENGVYELTFGDGVIGKALSVGNVINVSYIACNADLPNNARRFSYTGSFAGATLVVNTVTPAYGGEPPELISSIKWNAPRAYATQNRCVTAEDYRTLITTLYPGAHSVNVWGGESNVPPEYGKVFISVVPQDADYLTPDQKQYILDTVVNPRKALSITPVIVDPIYLRIELTTSFYYNPQATTLSGGDLISLVTNTITSYDADYLSTFGSVYKHSKLSALIDNTEKSITSNITTIKLHREVTPIYGVITGYTVNLGNPIYDSEVPEESVISTGFYTPSAVSKVCYLDDLPDVDGTRTGVIRLFYYDPTTNEKIVVGNRGTINYNTGVISIEGLNITQLFTAPFKLIIKPQSNDVASTQNQFVEIDPQLTTVTAIIDKPAADYRFTSSRN